MPGACFGSRDSYYSVRVGEIYNLLKGKSKVKPEYGWWGNIKSIAKLCEDDYKQAKKEGEEAEKRIHEDAIWDESVRKEIEKCSLNGREILDKAIKSCREQLEAERKGVK